MKCNVGVCRYLISTRSREPKPTMSPAPKVNTNEPTNTIKCADLRPGDPVSSILLLCGLEQRSKKNGDPYFFLTLRDSSAQVQGVMWDNHEPLQSGEVKNDDFVYVEGHVSEFNGANQLTLRKIHFVDDSNVDLNDFLAFSPRPRDEMEAELDEWITGITQPDCRRLLEKLFNHKRFRELYCTAPAAAHVHQAYIGGLLEHTLNVVRNAVQMANHYGAYDKDLLITAGLLHDIGKIREYDWHRSITYTDEGRLLGHISIGANMVDGAVRALQRESEEGFSTHYHHHILHIILSHHGKLEYGSPVMPKTKEALILHYADYADAYLTNYCDLAADLGPKGQTWTSFNRMFEANMYVGPGAGEAAPTTRAEALAKTPSANESGDIEKGAPQPGVSGGSLAEL